MRQQFRVLKTLCSEHCIYMSTMNTRRAEVVFAKHQSCKGGGGEQSTDNHHNTVGDHCWIVATGTANRVFKTIQLFVTGEDEIKAEISFMAIHNRIRHKKSAMSQKFPLLSLNVWVGSRDFLKLFIAVYHRSIHLL
jgi:hypothetical protein